MSETWFVADLHLGHERILRFESEEGRALRPFATVEEMHERIADEWTSRVRKRDTVNVLGDVAFRTEALALLDKLPGRKVLVPGNHDERPAERWLRHFDDVRGYLVYRGFICSHVPLHPVSVRRWGGNLHGHLHANTVKTTVRDAPFQPVVIDDPLYVCCSLEQTDYAPISLDEVRRRFAAKQETTT